jgi:hypothetical protein
MNFHPALAFIDNLVILVILVLLSWASAWFKKWQEKKAGEPAPEHQEEHSPKPTSQPRPVDLEDIFRQLMGDPPAEAPAPPPLPRAQRETAPPSSTPPVVQPQGNNREIVIQLPPIAKPAKAAVPIPAAVTQAVSAFSLAPQKPALASPKAPASKDKHLLGNNAQIVSNRRRRSSEGAEAVGLVVNRRSVRQAFVASVVLGRPKSLEPEQHLL